MLEGEGGKKQPIRVNEQILGRKGPLHFHVLPVHVRRLARGVVVPAPPRLPLRVQLRTSHVQAGEQPVVPHPADFCNLRLPDCVPQRTVERRHRRRGAREVCVASARQRTVSNQSVECFQACGNQTKRIPEVVLILVCQHKVNSEATTQPFELRTTTSRRVFS